MKPTPQPIARKSPSTSRRRAPRRGLRWAFERLRTTAVRAGAAITAMVLLALARAGPAAAAATTTATAMTTQTPTALAWIELKDSRGISVWNYELSINRGGITSPGAFVWSVGADTAWQLYRSTAVVALWFLDWVMAFEWVPVIAAPLLAVGEAMGAVVERLGVVPTLLTVAAVIAVIWMVRGRWATGIWELGMTCVIATLALGVFASPVALIAGPDGAIMGTQRAALELAAQINPGADPGSSAGALREAQSGAMVDTFIRQPTQMVNFGRVLDRGACQGAYDEVLRAGPYGDGQEIADAVGGCDEASGQYAQAPSAAMVLGTVTLIPGALAILGASVLLAGSVIAAGISAMYASVKAVITLVTGLLPGGARTSFFLTATSALVSLAILGLTTIFLSVFMLVIQALFASSGGQEIPKTFLIVDIVLVVGALVYWRQRKHLAATAERMAHWMSWRPGGAPRPPAPAPSGSHLGAAAAAAGLLAQLRAARTAAAASGAGRGAAAMASATDARQLIIIGGQSPGANPPPGASPRPPRPPRPHPGSPGPLALGPSPSPSPRRSVAALGAGAALSLGASAAMGAATGGSSTALSTAMTAARAAASARRTAMSARLATATTPTRSRAPLAPSSGRTPPPTPPGAASPVVTGQVLASRPAPAPQRAARRTSSLPVTRTPTAAPPQQQAQGSSAQAWAAATSTPGAPSQAVAAASAGSAHAVAAVRQAAAATAATARRQRAKRR